MPPEEMWQSFFEPTAALAKLGLTSACELAVDMGCGYGTFAAPLAALATRVVAIDIEADMVSRTRMKCLALPNVDAIQRDFVERGSGLPDGFADYVTLFNILHADEARELLAEARRILRVGGLLGLMHWNYDAATPRGPSMAVRLQPSQCAELVRNAGFQVGKVIDLPPYHYGFQAVR